MLPVREPMAFKVGSDFMSELGKAPGDITRCPTAWVIVCLFSFSASSCLFSFILSAFGSVVVSVFVYYTRVVYMRIGG